MSRIRVFGPLLLLLVLSATAYAQTSEVPRPGITPRLSRAMIDKDFPLNQADGRLSIWVYFTDKGSWTEAELNAALDDAKKKLAKRSIRRRAKMKRRRQNDVIDMMDLAVLEAYVNAVLETGATKRQVSRWLNAVSFDANPDQINAIAALPFVARVDYVQKFKRTPVLIPQGELQINRDILNTLRADKSQSGLLDYGSSLPALEQINVPQVHAEGISGKGVLVGMMDTGFRLTHETLTHINVLNQWDFVNNDNIVDTEPGDPPTSHVHGTMTLSTIAGFRPGKQVGPAYDIDVILAKTEDVSQEIPIEEDNWVAGIEWLEGLGVDIVSSSLGYFDWYVFADLDGNTAVCTIAADIAVGRGVVVVNSAGNERNLFGHIIAPADGDSVITAGAVTVTDALASFSSPGPTFDGRIKPDIAALGSAVYVANPNIDNAYNSVAGTSFSCPLSAGVAALILSRVPMMNPLQVREALRMTADRALNPDNDFGWGIIDAHAAVHYFGPLITHDPLPDSENTLAPHVISCRITDRAALDPLNLRLYYRINGGAWQNQVLTAVGGDIFNADIPVLPSGTLVEYYLTALDDLGIETRAPAEAPLDIYAFNIGPDTQPPLIAHLPLGDTPLQIWPPRVRADVTDNLGVASVSVGYAVNGAPQPGFNLSPAGGDLFQAAFPLPASSLVVGDLISYTITAVDASSGSNTTMSGTYVLQIINALGNVLLVDDTSAKSQGVGKFNQEKLLLAAPKIVTASITQDIERWLLDLGYVVTKVSSSVLTVADLSGQDVVLLSSGSNAAPMAGAAPRQVIVDWTAAGGHLLVEGGETTYDALVSPKYINFGTTCLRASAWGGDTGGNLIMSGQPLEHPLTSYPDILPQTIPMNLQAFTDQDMAFPNAGTTILFSTAASYQYGGVLVHDDNPAPAGGQIVNFCFNLGAVADTTTAKSLLCNAMSWLVANEGTPTCAIDGFVIEGNTGDVILPIPNALLDLGNGQTALSDPGGSFLINGLYPGDYVLEYSRSDLSVERLPITLIEGQTLHLNNLALYPVTSLGYLQATPVIIPDNDAMGIVSMIDVAASGRVTRLNVDLDLAHPWVGDLVVTLTSPLGTTVRLHNRGGSSSDNILGNYPLTLIVSGPGVLDDFHNQDISGTWTLRVYDLQVADIGTLQGWGLTLIAAQPSYAGLPELSSQQAHLDQNTPNPFNPRTTIRFETFRPSAPELSIFDMRGRQVRRLLGREVLPAAEYSIIWNGDDDQGRRLPSGIYLYRLVVDGKTEQRKMLMAR